MSPKYKDITVVALMAIMLLSAIFTVLNQWIAPRKALLLSLSVSPSWLKHMLKRSVEAKNCVFKLGFSPLDITFSYIAV
jgi:hypothetical protein